MNIFTILLDIFLFLIITHLIFLPLSKKRPIIIKGVEKTLFFITIPVIFASIIHPYLFLPTILIAVLSFYFKSWIIYGITKQEIETALQKAILATRAQSIRTESGYIVDNIMEIKIQNLAGKINLIQYKTTKMSNKTKLTKEIFRKFIQNYFIK